MPWQIVKNGGPCGGAKPWAVLTKPGGAFVGCHPTKKSASEQLKALYANEPKKEASSMRRASSLQAGEDRRDLPLSSAELEIRAADDDPEGAPHFTGYAMKWGVRTLIGALPWGFYEEIAPGAASKTLSEGDQRMLIQHDPYYVVSRMSAGTLRLDPDDTGLPVDSDLDQELSYVPDLIANVRNKNISGMSFGFRVIKDDWTEEQIGEADDGTPIMGELRTIREMELIEVSPVTFPAYDDTSTGLRATDPVRAVGMALARRDSGLIEARSAWCPELLHYRAAVASHSTATSDASWSASDSVGNLPDDATSADLRACYAWVDSSGDSEVKGSYKLPHHFVDSAGSVGAASTVACSAGIAALNGGRGGVDIPDGDRQAVYNHLAKHLKDADMEPPELKAAAVTDADVRELYADLRHLLIDLRDVTTTHREHHHAPVEEPAAATPGEDTTTDHGEESEPAASTRSNAPSIEDRMNALRKRYHLPVA